MKISTLKFLLTNILIQKHNRLLITILSVLSLPVIKFVLEMISARFAGLLAVATSIGSLLTVFFYIPALVVKIGSINEQVKV